MNKLRVINIIYYHLKPLISRRLQIWLRSRVILKKRKAYSETWPILEKAGNPPEGCTGWPDKKQFAFVLTHDVDTMKGHEKTRQLSEIEKGLGFRSSFNFVPARYEVSNELRHHLASNGFEVGIHGLLHDGKLYACKKTFQERAIRINQFLKSWGAVGFRSPAMHRNLDWLHDLDIEYDSSTFDTDPFEPQPDGAGTIFPFWVQGNCSHKGYVELPYTLPQDFTLFVLMKERNINIWKEKLHWIVEKGGMALLNTHPDYINFSGNKKGIEQYPVRYYEEFLEYIKTRYRGMYWHALPKKVARFYKHQRKEL